MGAKDFQQLVAEEVDKGLVLPNPEDSIISLKNLSASLRKISQKLADSDFESIKPGELAKMASYVAKTIDEQARLMEFAKGNADSRSEVVGLSDLLKVLTQDQFDQVQAWIAAGVSRDGHTGRDTEGAV